LLADAARQPLPVLPAVTADDAKIVMYTSGTTGNPKAVIHSHASIACALYNGADSWKLGRSDRMLMPSPVTHVTGYVNGIELPFFTDTKTILMQQWEVARAVELIESYGATTCISATPFLQELVERCRDQGKTLPGFRLFACGGAAVPPTLIEQAGRVLSDCRAFRVYGSTEVPLVTVGFSEAEESWLAANTDGKIYNYEVKVVDQCGHPQPLECDGELMVRGPAQMVGYKCVEQNRDARDPEGFFATGDIGHVTPAGAIVVTDRKKDIIIRGGENLSAREIEELLLLHPTIVAAAAVAFPHPRLGEGVCACLVLAEGSPGLDVESLKPHLEAVGLAKQKWPEKVVLMYDFPMTASGKVRKDQLRKQLLSS
jgi:acyl-CoA synthetase (AMP-forming)/AMP-acid ligase II